MPNIGEIVHSKDRGLKSKQTYIWAACTQCGKEHWIECHNGKPVYNICFKCGRPKKKVWELITTEPYLGEIRRSDQIEGYAKCKTKYTYEECPNCHHHKWVQISAKGKYPKCRKCMNRGKIKEKSGTWKGGIKDLGTGYKMVRLYPNDPFYDMCNKTGYVFEHRLVMAKELGRPLYDWEEVHHKGETFPAQSKQNKSDNIPENLFVTGTEHHNTLVEYVLKLQAIEIKEQKSEITDLKSRVTLLEAENTLLKVDMSEFI
jgi:hypothetical protein